MALFRRKLSQEGAGWWPLNFWRLSSVYQQTQPSVRGSAHSSKHRDRVWSILISHQDVNFRPPNYTTEYPLGQSRKHFSSSCPESWGLSSYCPKSSQDHKDPAIPLHFSQSQIVIDTGLRPWWPWLTETKMDPTWEPTWEPNIKWGLWFKGQGAHTGQWGYTNMQSIYFWGLFFLCSVFFFYQATANTALAVSMNARDAHSHTRDNYVINTIKTNFKKNQ